VNSITLNASSLLNSRFIESIFANINNLNTSNITNSNMIQTTNASISTLNTNNISNSTLIKSTSATVKSLNSTNITNSELIYSSNATVEILQLREPPIMYYTQPPQYNNVSQVGYSETNISYSNPSLDTTTETEIASIGLPMGVWFLQGSCTFQSVSGVPGGSQLTSLSISKINTTSDPYYKISGFVNSTQATNLNITRMEVNNQNTSYYLVARDTAIRRLCSDIKLNAIRIA
jgi:hypothetical protein